VQGNTFGLPRSTGENQSRQTLPFVSQLRPREGRVVLSFPLRLPLAPLSSPPTLKVYLKSSLQRKYVRIRSLSYTSSPVTEVHEAALGSTPRIFVCLTQTPHTRLSHTLTKVRSHPMRYLSFTFAFLRGVLVAIPRHPVTRSNGFGRREPRFPFSTDVG